MREMKDSGIEWIGKIPENWNVSRISFLYDVVLGKMLDSTNMETVSNYLCAANIKWTGVNTEIEKKMYFSEEEKDQYLLIDNDVLIMEGGSVGTSCVYHNEFSPCYIQNSVHRCRAKSFNVNKYLYYWMYVVVSSNYITNNCNKATIMHYTKEKVQSTPILSLPKVEQIEIVLYLDQKCSDINNLISDIQSQIQTLEEYKRSVITEAVTKGLDPNAEMKDSGIEWLGIIPKKWSIVKGKYIFVQRNDKGNKIELQLLSPTQKYGVIPQKLYEEISRYKAVKLDEKTDMNELKTIHKGDYCISLRSFQGGFEYSEYEGVVSPAYQVFYPVIEVYRGYYKHLFKTQIFIDKMDSYTMSLRDGKNIAFADFGNTYIPMPPIEDQQQISDYLDKKCSEIDKIISEKQQQIETIEEYKKSLIFEYVTGKKEVM